MTNARLALIGGGGFAREVAEVAELLGFEITGCYSSDPGNFAHVYRGDLDELARHKSDYDAVALAVGGVNRRTLTRRNQLVETMEAVGLPCPALVSPHAICAKGSVVGKGVFIGHNVTLGVGAQMRDYAIANIGAIIGHDTVIGRNSIVAPGAFIGGNCAIGDNTLLGPLSKILQGLKIGSDVIVGVGCTALRPLGDGTTVWPRPDRTT